MKFSAALNLGAALSEALVGQPAAVEAILPCLRMYHSGLAPEGRPAGIFLLLGPTGTGKTHTVEVLAELLHGSRRQLLQINCGELQADHEIAKLVGAPPGYIGHRETRPLLSQSALADVTSPDCDLSLVLFDEIEKASPALMPLLLAALDKGTMQLGDGTTVDFNRSLIFLTSNLGAREMSRELAPAFGFQARAAEGPRTHGRLAQIAVAAVRRRFSPEFVNRLDAIVTYKPLDARALDAILGQHIDGLRQHVRQRLGQRAFDIETSADARRYLLDAGTSAEYGARELKRTIQRHLTQPLAGLVANGEIAPGSRVSVEMNAEGTGLMLVPSSPCAASPMSAPAPATVLVVERNRSLLSWLGRVLEQNGYDAVLADSPEQARQRLGGRVPDAALIACEDAAGAQLARELRKLTPAPHVAVMSSAEAARDAGALSRELRLPVLRKPFLGEDVLGALQGALPAGRPAPTRHLRAS